MSLKLAKDMEMRGIEPRAFHMRSERSTTELHPHYKLMFNAFPIIGSQSLLIYLSVDIRHSDKGVY